MDFEKQLLEKTLQLDKELQEVFSINNKDQLIRDLKDFLKGEFTKGDITAKHQGLSTTEYKPDDWYEDMANNIVNRMIQYFNTIKGQTERNL